MLFHYLFLIGSIGGFFLELFYRKIIFNKWIKPGVFKGCYLPLYGMGLVICYFCYLLSMSVIFKLVLVMFLLTFIELMCGVIFIKKLRIPLWDYSNEFFNYKGIICLKYSISWLLLGGMSFLVFEYVNWPITKIMNIVVLLFEIVLGVDVILFFLTKIMKNKKRKLHLDL